MSVFGASDSNVSAMPTSRKQTSARSTHPSVPKTGRPPVVFPRECRLLKGLDAEGFRRICECLSVKEVHLKNKQTFIVESDPCNHIGIVVSGAVLLTRFRIGGGRSVLETIQPNGVFGTTYVFRDVATMGINASAVGETTVLLFEIQNITRPCHKACDAHMQFVRNLLTVMSQTSFTIKQKLRVLSQRTIRGRLMLFLQIRAKRAKSNEFDIPYDRQALADYLCVDRSALSAELSKLRAEHVLESVKQHFKLLV